MSRWNIAAWIGERLLDLLTDGGPPPPNMFFRSDGRTWLRFNGMEFRPTAHRVVLLLDGKEVAWLQAPRVEHGGTLTVSGELVGYIPFSVECETRSGHGVGESS